MAKCKESVYRGREGSGPCNNETGDKETCGIHSPEAKARRKAKSQAHYAAQAAKRDARYARYSTNERRLAAYPAMAAALRELKERAEEAEQNHTPVKARKILELCNAALANEPE